MKTYHLPKEPVVRFRSEVEAVEWDECPQDGHTFDVPPEYRSQDVSCHCGDKTVYARPDGNEGWYLDAPWVGPSTNGLFPQEREEEEQG